MHGSTIRTTILTLAALAWAAAAAAGDLPAQEQRIWAPTGDLVGLQNHATASFQDLDAHGSEAKGAEDWQLLGKYSGSLLAGWHRTSAKGLVTDLGLYGTNEQGSGLAGRLDFRQRKPARFGWGLILRGNDQYYDPTSEMRAPAFKYPPAPPSLPSTPHLQWRREDVKLGGSPGRHLGLSLAASRFDRKGTKSSLLRQVSGTGANGDEAPGLKAFDTRAGALGLGGTAAIGALAADAVLDYRESEGGRSLDSRQAYDDDRKTWRFRVDAGYDLAARTRVLGGFAASRLENDGSQVRAAASTSWGRTNTVAGRLGLVTGLGHATTLSVGGLVQSLDTDARQVGGTGLLATVDRQRTRRQVQAAVVNTGLARTRLELRYRYSKADLDQDTGENDLPGGPSATRTQTVEQDTERHDLALRARRRFGHGLLARAAVGWNKLTVDETTAGSAWFTVLGDREQERLDWSLALQTRPAADLKVDLGWRGWDRTRTRTADAGSETSWRANTVFARVNWNAHARVTLYGDASWGVEKLTLTGVTAPTGTMGPVAYDGRTLRFMPGATVRVRDGLWVDAAYEGVRFKDDADASAALDALESDHDRTLARVRWTPRADRTVAVTYRRHAFDENRWDDFIQDVWQASVSGRF